MYKRSVKKSVMGGAAYLAAALGAAKIVSAVFRLALTNVLGAEGLGLYQLAFPIYSLLVTVTATCMSVAVSRLVAEKAASGGIGREYLLPGIVLAALPSVLLGAAVLLFSDKIAAVQGNSAVKTGYFAIIPAVIFVAAGSVFKGWFQGRFNLVPTAFSGVFSQAVKLVAGLGLAVYLKKYGTAGAVFGALTGVAISEAAGCVYLAFRYLKETKSLPKLDRKTCAKDVYKELFKTVVPIMLGSVILPISGFTDTFLVVNVLKAQGLTTEIATSEYGLMSGAVSSLVGLPVALAVAFSVAVVPAVAASGAERNLDAVISKCKTSVKLAYLVGVPATAFLFALSGNIISLFYPNLSAEESGLAVRLLAVACFSATPLTLLQIYNSILQALGRTLDSVWNMVFAVALKILLSVALIYTSGIIGFAVASLAFSAVAAGLGRWRIRKLLGNGVKLLKNAYEIVLSGVIIGVAAYFVQKAFQRPILSVAFAALAAGALYVVCVFAFKVLDEEEMSSLPLFGKRSKKLGEEDL